MSVLSKAPLPSGDDVRRVALAALSAALENGTQQEEKKPKRSGPMKGVRTVATGAALFVAGRAAYKGRHAILDQLDGGRQEDGDEEEDDDVGDEEEEPSAEEDEDFEDEDEEEPEEDEDFEDEDEEEPEAEEDEDFEDE